MARNKKIIAAFPVFLAIAVFAWLPYANSQTSKSVNKKAGKNFSAIHDQAQSMIKEYSLVRASPKISADWGERNPFNGGYAAEDIQNGQQDHKENTSSVEYVLGGIFWNEQKPSAIINDSVVGVGSTVGLAMVKEITEDRVVLSHGNNEVVLVPRPGE